MVTCKKKVTTAEIANEFAVFFWFNLSLYVMIFAQNLKLTQLQTGCKKLWMMSLLIFFGKGLIFHGGCWFVVPKLKLVIIFALNPHEYTLVCPREGRLTYAEPN